MTKERFYEGDVVDLVPYAAVGDHLGIYTREWDSFYALNPHVVTHVDLDHSTGEVNCYEIATPGVGWSYCWPPNAFVLHVEPTIVEVGDLL